MDERRIFGEPLEMMAQGALLVLHERLNQHGTTVVKTAADVESLDPDCRSFIKIPLEWCYAAVSSFLAIRLDSVDCSEDCGRCLIFSAGRCMPQFRRDSKW